MLSPDNEDIFDRADNFVLSSDFEELHKMTGDLVKEFEGEERSAKSDRPHAGIMSRVADALLVEFQYTKTEKYLEAAITLAKAVRINAPTVQLENWASAFIDTNAGKLTDFWETLKNERGEQSSDVIRETAKLLEAEGSPHRNPVSRFVNWLKHLGQ